MGEHGLVPSGSGYGQLSGSCEHGNEHSSPIKCGQLLDQLITLAFLKKPASWIRSACVLFLHNSNMYYYYYYYYIYHFNAVYLQLYTLNKPSF
jgi:hypothetical protein